MPMTSDFTSIRRHIHVLTPGDHFSPRTGSAIPTVVHGLAGATPPSLPRASVVVAEGTYPDRYPSADVIEYAPVPGHRLDRYADAAMSRVGLGRPSARRSFAATVEDQASWAPSVVFAHNAPALVPLVAPRHEPVLYAHNDLLRTYGPAEAYRTLRQARAVVCVSRFLAERMRPRLDARVAGKLRVVRPGVDTDFFRPRDPGLGTERRSGEPVRVVFVGRMLPEKGAHVVLAALAALDRDDIQAVFVGSHGFDPTAPPTRYESEIRARAAALRRPAEALPFQPRAQIAELLGGADVAVVPSMWPEPAGLTVLEGMASGAAVIASRVGGIPELAGDAATLVPPDDADALAQVLEGWATDRAALSRARYACRAHAEAHGWDRARRVLDAALAAEG